MGWWQERKERILGNGQRLGWWTLPVFLAVGLLGAVLAGTLSVLFYSQQVDALRDQTRSARTEADQARDEIRDTADEALAEVQERVDAVRQSLTTDLPVPDAFAAGVVVVTAYPGPPPRSGPSSPPASPSPGGGGTALSPVGHLQEEQESPQPQPSPAPAPRDRGTPRTGAGFAVVRDGPTTFFVTSFELVEDPDRSGQVVQDLEVTTGSGTFPAALHSFDRGRDLALLRADAGEVTVSEWRPLDQELSPGDKVWAVGVTPTLNTVRVGGSVAAVEPGTILTDVAVLAPVRGGPLVDLDGRVLGVVAPGFHPFGGDGEGRAVVAIRALCEGLLRCSDDDLGGTPAG